MNHSSNVSLKYHHHVIVLLEKLLPSTPLFNLPSPHTYELRQYDRTHPNELADRVRGADIIIRTVVPMTADLVTNSAAATLKMIAVVGSGTDTIDLEACRARGILVANTPHCNTSAVAEHAIGMYFALRRQYLHTHRLVQTGEWAKRGMLAHELYGPDRKAPQTCRDEIVGILGYGGVGQKVATMAKALGMKVLLSGRKGSSESPDRTPFEVVIRTASVLILCLPRSQDTVGYISSPEFQAMQRHSVLINVSRGGIVDEEALVAALEDGRIAGAATDVFAKEPASEESSPLLGARVENLNLITTPHTAWVAEETNKNYLETLQRNIEAFVCGSPINCVV
ncbi:glycerate dehydrogenase [Fusarium beomiforme]|uniref:Glycerate dehydrogenase n=1 Tax=Fusarium beomiforme TaxID=44412 RepID=A0A9P5A8F0_9HYPO|nr:glycerate dehydrogenase [Fusarium beomiforme]